MNYEFFIAKRIIGSKAYKSSISAPIIKIGIAAIAIGIVVMMIAIATGIGLQQKIRDKVVAFKKVFFPYLRIKISIQILSR